MNLSSCEKTFVADKEKRTVTKVYTAYTKGGEPFTVESEFYTEDTLFSLCLELEIQRNDLMAIDKEKTLKQNWEKVAEIEQMAALLK